MNLQELKNLINKEIRELAPYHLTPENQRIKLNQNENPFDWPLEIKQKITKRCVDRVWSRYPEFIPQKLNAILAEYTGVSSDMIISGNGSNEILLTLCLALTNIHRPVIVFQPTFTVYKLLLKGLGRKLQLMNLNNDFSYDVKGILSLPQELKQSVLIVCSPNNPTGNSLSENELHEILNGFEGFIILDQAYIEFGGFNAISLLKDYPNLIITRTFSKALGGAGIRLGYLLGTPEIVAQINKIKLPYNINFFTEYIASEFLAHKDLIKKNIALILNQRDIVFDFLKTLPFQNVYPSDTNFLLIRTEDKEALFSYLKKNDVLIRDVSAYPMLKNCLRISIGTEEENNVLMKTLTMFYR